MAEPFANESTAVRTGLVDSIKQSELTAHTGKWTSGVSRKSKKFGGKLRYEKD